MRRDLITARGKKGFNRFLPAWRVAGMRHRMAKIELIGPPRSHQATSDDLASDNLILKLLNSEGIEIRVRVCVITQDHPGINPLLQQGNSRLYFSFYL